MDLKQLGARIKARREKRGLRQIDIANALDISTQAVSKWERGENAPDISVLVELSRLLAVSVEWILGGTTADTDTLTATVFCTSLNGYAERCAVTPPRDIAAWANSIYYSVTEALLRFDGVPVKYLGDGFLGFFAGRNQMVRALKAAFEAQRLIDTPDFITVLHRGEIYLGSIGHPDYAEPDIIGQTVNTAFLAMPWVAKNTESAIGITQAAADALPDQSTLLSVGEVEVLGETKSIMVYEPGPNTKNQIDTID